MSDANWETSDVPQEGLVSSAEEGGAQLFLASNGAPRQAGQPVVVFETGLGFGSTSWTAVQRLLDPRIRSYRYDRAGYGRSPASTTERSASNMAAELLSALRAAGIAPPYILAAHSFGALVAREVLAQAGPDAVAAMVLVDAFQENTHLQLHLPVAAIQALCHGRDYLDVIGLRRENGFTPAELERAAEDEAVPTAKDTAAREADLLLASSTALAARRQLDARPLGTHPVTVVRGDAGRDFGRLLEAAEDDDGEHVEEMRHFLRHRFVYDRELQMQQCRLSANSRFVQAARSGHAVIATEPELVAGEISRVWQGAVEGT